MSPARRKIAWVIAGSAVCVSAIAVFAWFTWFSLATYPPPPGHLAIDATRTHRVFAYGTLRFSLVRRLVIGRAVPAEPAVLPGHREQGLDVEPAAGARVEGRVFEVDAAGLRRLDRYERVGIRYARTELRLADGAPAWVYSRVR